MFVPYNISRILRDRAIQLYAHHKTQSMWFIEDGIITICTTSPGLWIGKAGKDHEELKEKVLAEAAKYGDKVVNICYKECQR